MDKKDDDLSTRLQQAALALFRERGFDRTTAAAIAARAGVTERTFFRHFPDKREVLFVGEPVLRAALIAAIAEAPPRLGALATLFRAFQTVVPLIEANRSFSEPRQAIITTTPALLEREAAKLAALVQALAGALMDRGVDDLRSDLAAQSGMAAFAQATAAWLADPTLNLASRISLAQAALKTLLSDADE